MTTIQISLDTLDASRVTASCENCGEPHTVEDLKPIQNAERRLVPGYETPAGECKECGCLCYIDIDKPDKIPYPFFAT